MSKDTFHFVVITKATFEHENGAPTSTLKQVDLRLEVSGNLDKSNYVDDGLPLKEAAKPIASTLVAGLLANIKNCHDKGWWKDHEQMHWIIDALERGFVEHTTVREATMEDYTDE